MALNNRNMVDRDYRLSIIDYRFIYISCSTKYQYLPKSFVQSVIVSLVKCKRVDSTDVNNHKAITVSNALSELFETVIFDAFPESRMEDGYQFGFKPGHSTRLYARVF